MCNVTNWHVEKLINTYNEKFNKQINYIDLNKFISFLNETDTRTDVESEQFLVDILEYPGESDLYVYISRNAFELCILDEKPTMEVKV